MDIERSAPVRARHIGQPRAIGRPTRRAIGRAIGQQGLVPRAIEIGNPDLRHRAVGHDVVRLPHIDRLRSVRRHLRFVRPFQLEHILGREQARPILSDGGCGCGKAGDGQGKNTDPEHGAPSFRHWVAATVRAGLRLGNAKRGANSAVLKIFSRARELNRRADPFAF